MKRLPALLLPFIMISCSPAWQRLHKKAIVIDTHNDALSTVSMRGLNMDQDLTGRTHTDIHRLKKGGIDVQVFSVFSDERFGKDTAFQYANIEIDSLYAIVARNPGRMMMVTSPGELSLAVKQGMTGCMIGVEGGHMIEDKLEYLDALYNRGARYLTLTWNHSTSWATSAWDETKQTIPVSQFGLNDFGKQVVRRMNELGMMIDVSHVGEKTFWDVIGITTKPIIASHSCAHTLCPVPRNLKDEQVKAIAKNGGVIHLNFYSGFIDSSYERRKNDFMNRYQKQADSLRKLKWANYEVEEWILEKYPGEAESLRPPLSMLLDHLDHIVKLAGIDHVGIGSDFDGIESAPSGLDDVSDMPVLTKALLDRGYQKNEIRKILGDNFIRVFKANQTN
ncbi:MAG TPA: dipeptidase [Flavisolibacter sp.]